MDIPKEEEVPAWKKFGILPWILTVMLIASTGLNLWQKNQLTTFEKELEKCQTQLITVSSSHQRAKRSIPTEIHSSFYLPLYTQLTPQVIKQLCDNRYDMMVESNDNNSNDGIKSESDMEQRNNDVIIIPATSTTQVKEQKANNLKQLEKNRTNKWKTGLSKNGKRKSYYKIQKAKSCPLIKSLNERVEYGQRMYEIGSALRSNDLWYITEYAMGYMLFEYNASANDLDNRLRIPSNIYTLPMPFYGNDHAIARHRDGSSTFYYQVSSTNTILGYNVKDDKSVQKELEFDRKPLYKHSASQVDLEYDDGILYGIYRESNNTALTVIKLHPYTLKQLERHQIVVHFSDDLINSFIRCNVFYAVRQGSDKAVNIEPIYDLSKSEYIKLGPSHGSTATWKPYNIPANVQFDPLSQSLNCFDHGHIYSMPIVF